ncbi:MAG: hypothetical protein ACREXR_16370, partial [Gammaproteobacteria bacterium]
MFPVFFYRKRAFVFLVNLSISLIAGCATVELPFETPFGPTPGGKAFANLQVIGIVSLQTRTGNLSTARPFFSTKALVEVPVGTVFIVPAMRGWDLGYGQLNSLPGSDVRFDWSEEDHHYGLGGAYVAVTKINPVNTTVSPPTQTAEIEVNMILTDQDFDDSWFGSAAYTLICFGPQPPDASAEPLKLDPPNVVI